MTPRRLTPRVPTVLYVVEVGSRHVTRRGAIRTVLGGSAAVVLGGAAAGFARAEPAAGPAPTGPAPLGSASAVSPSVASAATARQPARRDGPPPAPPGWELGNIGMSAQGRPIERWTSRPKTPTRHVMIMAGIHGNERITYPLADAISRAPRPADLTLSIVPSVNPDGWAADTRRNSNGVDLNRNFPWLWGPGDGGPFAASEVETRAMMQVIEAERPDLVIWLHQPLSYVSPLPGCPMVYAQSWAAAAGVQVRTGINHLGGAETWTAQGAGVRSMLVEVTSWATSDALIAAHRAGFEALIAHVEPA